MLDLKEIDRLSRAETIIIEPGHETNCSLAQFRELVEAARAWELWRRNRLSQHGIDPDRDDIRWDWWRDEIAWTLWTGGQLTPQAAVLAALAKGAKT